MQAIQAIKKPTKRTQQNLNDLIINTRSLGQKESEWVREGPDLVALGQVKEHAWLNIFLNGISKRMTSVSRQADPRSLRGEVIAAFGFHHRQSFLTEFRPCSGARSRI